MLLHAQGVNDKIKNKTLAADFVDRQIIAKIWGGAKNTNTRQGCTKWIK